MPSLPRFERGYALTAESLNRLVEAIERNQINLPSGGSLVGHQGPWGTDLWGEDSQPTIQWAFLSISGAISAASGATLGTVTTGTVKLCTRSGSTLTAGTIDISSNLFNSAAAISGTASGKFIIVGLMADYSYSVLVSPC